MAGLLIPVSRTMRASMRTLFIAGHSDSGGGFLPAGVHPWPERTRQWLSEVTGEDWHIVEVRFAPIGSRATDYLLGKVAAASPDLLVLPFSAYVCTVGSVEESVRARFGERPARWFRSVERPFQEKTAQGGPVSRRTNRTSRVVARKVLGARAMATVEQTAAIYEEVLHRLARIESLQVAAIIDARFSTAIQEWEPKLHQRFDALYARLLPVVDAHRFLKADLEGKLQEAPDRAVFYHPDGVHTTVAFHEVYFEVMKGVLGPVYAPRGAM